MLFLPVACYFCCYPASLSGYHHNRKSQKLKNSVFCKNKLDASKKSCYLINLSWVIPDSGFGKLKRKRSLTSQPQMRLEGRGIRDNFPNTQHYILLQFPTSSRPSSRRLFIQLIWERIDEKAKLFIKKELKKITCYLYNVMREI